MPIPLRRQSHAPEAARSAYYRIGAPVISATLAPPPRAALVCPACAPSTSRTNPTRFLCLVDPVWKKINGLLKEEALAKKILPIAGKKYFLNGEPKKPQQTHKIKTIYFTSAGRELRGIVQMEPNPVYIERLRKWVQVTLGLELLEVLKVIEGSADPKTQTAEPIANVR